MKQNVIEVDQCLLRITADHILFYHISRNILMKI